MNRDTSTNTGGAVRGSRWRGSVRRFVPLALLMPIAKSVVGIDGGALFQVIASENLGMSSATIGLAFGLGVLSLPVQLLAARIPLARAKVNLGLFAAILGVLSAVMAVLVGVGPSSPVTVAAITVAVTAEAALSVLYATSWMPLQNALLATTERQWLSSRVRALGWLALVAFLLAVAAGAAVLRIVVFVVVAAVAIVVTVDLRASRHRRHQRSSSLATTRAHRGDSIEAPSGCWSAPACWASRRGRCSSFTPPRCSGRQPTSGRSARFRLEDRLLPHWLCGQRVATWVAEPEQAESFSWLRRSRCVWCSPRSPATLLPRL